MIKGIIFDLDGTLLDTTDGVLESACYAAKQLGYEELPRSTMLNFVGPPIQNSFVKYYGASVEQAQKAAEIFRTYYKEKALLKAKPYDGIFDMCQKLIDEGYKLAVATYKREDYAIELLRYFGFDRYFKVMHGADNFNKLTKADIVNICIQELEVKPSESVLIGDTEYDANGANNARIAFIGVTYGFGFKNKDNVYQYEALGHIDYPLELLDLMKKMGCK